MLLLNHLPDEFRLTLNFLKQDLRQGRMAKESINQNLSFAIIKKQRRNTKEFNLKR